MQNNLSFSDFLKSIFDQFENTGSNAGLVSICLELPNINLLNIYENFINQYAFSAFWEEKEELSYIAFGKCKYITLEGSNKFELAKKFNIENFRNLINLNKTLPVESSAKILYFFSFSNHSRKDKDSREVPNMEAVLPKIMIIKYRNRSWLRINAEINNKSSLRELLEEFWFLYELIKSNEYIKIKNNYMDYEINHFYSSFEASKNILRQNILKGIQLVGDGILKKIVISSRIIFKIKGELNLIKILKRLSKNQPKACRYVWKRNQRDITFGSSPEKLFSFKNNNLILEAIAGTSYNNLKSNDLLLRSSKNIREHEFVVNYLIECLKVLKINNFDKSDMKVKTFGNLSHLHTLINSNVFELCPFELLKVLHPSPAVCGYPKNQSFEWIETLENFSRGNYAAPIGWVDFHGNSDFRVAIRGARCIDNHIEFTAGSGIVKESESAKEMEEIKLKFESLVKEIFVTKIIK